MGAAPEGPCDDGGGLDPALRQACGHPADFLHRPADQRRLLRIIVRLLFGGAGILALRRMAASIAKASMTSETCRCQPCQDRVSLWSRPSSFLAVSKPSSMAQRRPSTATKVSISVPAGHQVAKKAGRWAIEDGFETAKNELGLDHNETRSWHGWHRHVSLVMLAFAMLAAIRLKADMPAPPKSSLRMTRKNRR